MFHSRTLNNKINKLQERALRIIYQDDKSSFEELLQRDNAVIVHNRNLQALAIQMYQVKHKLAPKVIQDLFSVKEDKLYN